MADEQLNSFGERVITDADGRKLAIKEVDVVEQLDLYELAGEQSTNPAWLGTAMTVASVRSINDVPRPFPRDRQNLKASLKQIGRAGLDAIRVDREALDAQAQAVPEGSSAGQTVDPVEVIAKN